MNPQIRQELIKWYHSHKRDLPWRETSDPYKIWLSEIILQQTRVAQGLPYYHKFVAAFPTVQSLADADEQQVLTLWAGLGYYSRARNLHKAAKQVISDFDGKFPTTYIDLMKLKGVGDYTASAIASFSSGEPVAVLDGNVFRVLSRLFLIEKDIGNPSNRKYFKQYANDLLDETNPADFNQAIMEFGALQCSPAPVCLYCPLRSHCMAFDSGMVKELPIKGKKTPPKDVFFHFFLMRHNGKMAIQKRDDKSIWKNMFQLPLQETQSSDHTFKTLEHVGSKMLWETKHQLTHRTIWAKFYELEYLPNYFENIQWIDQAELDQFPFPRLLERFFEKCLN